MIAVNSHFIGPNLMRISRGHQRRAARCIEPRPYGFEVMAKRWMRGDLRLQGRAYRFRLLPSAPRQGRRLRGRLPVTRSKTRLGQGEDRRETDRREVAGSVLAGRHEPLRLLGLQDQEVVMGP